MRVKRFDEPIPKGSKKAPPIPWTSGGALILDKRLTATFRAEFLQLMKAATNASNYDEAVKVSQAVRIWRERFEEVVFNNLVNRKIWDVIADSRHIPKDDKNQILSLYGREKLTEWVEYWQPRLRKTIWGFATELRAPLRTIESRRRDYAGTGQEKYVNEEAQFADYARERDQWIARAKRQALPAWKILDEFFEWMGEPPKPSFRLGRNQNVTLEGFRTRFVDYDDESASHNSMIRDIPPALRRFKERAQRVLPRLLQIMLPMELRFLCDLDEGGQYHDRNGGSFFSVCLLHRKPDEYVHIIAHEMGHHIWKRLSKDSQTFWTAAIKADYGTLDLREILSDWRKSGKRREFEFLDWLKDEDPINFLRLDALLHSKWMRDKGGPDLYLAISDIDELSDYIDKGGKTSVHVPKNPITVYANKNEEEAFCEAFGYLIAYGPRSLLERVRFWLKTTVPEINLV